MFVALNAPSQLAPIFPAGTGGALRQAKPQRPAFPPSKNCQLLARILRHSTSSTYSECAHTRKGVSRVSLCVRLVPQPSSRRIQRQLVLYVQLTFPLGQDGGKELTEQPKAFSKTGRATAASPSIHSSSTARRRSGEEGKGSSPSRLGCSRPWTRSCGLFCAPPC